MQGLALVQMFLQKLWLVVGSWGFKRIMESLDHACNENHSHRPTKSPKPSAGADAAGAADVKSAKSEPPSKAPWIFRCSQSCKSKQTCSTVVPCLLPNMFMQFELRWIDGRKFVRTLKQSDIQSFIGNIQVAVYSRVCQENQEVFPPVDPLFLFGFHFWVH